MTLGEKITKLRKEFNYTQEQLADIIDVSRQSVSKWESNISYPETDKLIVLGDIFDCSMDYLLRDDITEKEGKPTSKSACKIENLSKKILTDNNKSKVKKVIKIMGIALVIILAIDIISMIIYFCIYGIPH